MITLTNLSCSLNEKIYAEGLWNILRKRPKLGFDDEVLHGDVVSLCAAFAALDKLRFAILYRLPDANGMNAKELLRDDWPNGNALHSHLDTLMEANLITH